MRPTREQCGPHYRSPIWPYSGWGLPCHGMLPSARCALTAPFHPYQPLRASAVYFLWRFPSARAAQVLPGTLPYGARTFLPSPTRTWSGSGCLANSGAYYTSRRPVPIRKSQVDANPTLKPTEIRARSDSLRVTWCNTPGEKKTNIPVCVSTSIRRLSRTNNNFPEPGGTSI